ncbi:MAG: DinB family protein [bacterium]
MKLSEFFSNYFDVRKELIDMTKSLSQEQLDWSPPGHPAKIGKLLVHIADCEYFWINHVAKKIPNPDYAPFHKASTWGDYKALLDDCFEIMKDFLETEDIEDWKTKKYDFTDENGKTDHFTKEWLIWHVVEHQARHRGQVMMMMRTQGLDVPDV